MCHATGRATVKGQLSKADRLSKPRLFKSEATASLSTHDTIARRSRRALSFHDPDTNLAIAEQAVAAAQGAAVAASVVAASQHQPATNISVILDTLTKLDPDSMSGPPLDDGDSSESSSSSDGDLRPLSSNKRRRVKFDTEYVETPSKRRKGRETKVTRNSQQVKALERGRGIVQDELSPALPQRATRAAAGNASRKITEQTVRYTVFVLEIA